MAKRFSDTDLWDKDWFMPLPQKQKLLFQFLFSKCDASGVWSPNYILASTYIGSKVSKDDLKGLKNQIDILPDGKIFLIDFIEFQYGTLTETCMPHRKVIGLLKKHGLFERVSEGYQKGINTLQEEEEEKEEDKEEEKDKGVKGEIEETPFKIFQKWVKKNAPEVAKMKHPFTEDQFQKAVEKFGSEKVQSILGEMHNWKPLNEKRTDAYRTFLTFAGNSKLISIPQKDINGLSPKDWEKIA